MAWLSANWFLAVCWSCVSPVLWLRLVWTSPRAADILGPLRHHTHTWTNVHTQSTVKYTGTCPKAIRTVSSVCVCVQVRNAFNNLTQTDLDLTPSGSTKPLNPLLSPQYPQIIYTHTHTYTHPPSYITLRNLSGSSRLSHAFLFPFLPHPSNILLVGKGAVIAEVGSFLPAPTQQSKRPHRHAIPKRVCESRLISPYQGCIVLKRFSWSLFLIFCFILYFVFLSLCPQGDSIWLPGSMLGLFGK